MPGRKILVFISSPYTNPSPSQNVNNASLEWTWIKQNHGDRVVPISMVVFSHYQDALNPMGYHEWLEHCIDILRKCELVYVLPGESKRVDKELSVARDLGIPIVRSRKELAEFLEEHPEMFDKEIDRLRREIGTCLYEAKKKGADLANLGVGEAKRILGEASSRGSRAIGGMIAGAIKGSFTSGQNSRK